MDKRHKNLQYKNTEAANLITKTRTKVKKALKMIQLFVKVGSRVILTFSKIKKEIISGYKKCKMGNVH